jgi:hypothetical protein
MLDRKGGQLRVRDEIARDVDLCAEPHINPCGERSCGWDQTTGTASQSSTYLNASATDSGCSVTRGCVTIRRNAPMVCPGRPTRQSSSSVFCSQAAAAALWPLFSSTAYSSRFASTIIFEQINHVADICDVNPQADLRGSVSILDSLGVSSCLWSSLVAPEGSGPRSGPPRYDADARFQRLHRYRSPRLFA